MKKILGLILLLWMSYCAKGEEAMNIFIKDLIDTFKLASPAILYNSDEGIPEICYSSHWILCMPSNQHDGSGEGKSPNDAKSDKDSENNGTMRCATL